MPLVSGMGTETRKLLSGVSSNRTITVHHVAKEGGGIISATSIHWCASGVKLPVPSNTHPALERLLLGVKKFRREVYPDRQGAYQQLVREGQEPHTLFITCADSRIDPEALTQSARSLSQGTLATSCLHMEKCWAPPPPSSNMPWSRLMSLRS